MAEITTLIGMKGLTISSVPDTRKGKKGNLTVGSIAQNSPLGDELEDFMANYKVKNKAKDRHEENCVLWKELLQDSGLDQIVRQPQPKTVVISYSEGCTDKIGWKDVVATFRANLLDTVRGWFGKKKKLDMMEVYDLVMDYLEENQENFTVATEWERLNPSKKAYGPTV